MRFWYLYILLLIGIPGIAQQSKNKPSISYKKTNSYADNSVLASGNWFKLKVNKDAIYRITYSDLVQYGIDPSTLDPRKIRIFGNGGAMLPENNAEASYDDLIENAIYVSGESDGHFDSNDYILFFGQSPVKWRYDSIQQTFNHVSNYYSDETDYFLTYDNVSFGKRITLKTSSTQIPTNIITSFNDYQYHELDSVNLLLSGKEWYGEYFDAIKTHTFNFNFPGIDLTKKVCIRTNIAARNLVDSRFEITSGSKNDTLLVTAIPGSVTADFARYSEDTLKFIPAGQNIEVVINSQTTGTIGWLNFIDVNVFRNLSFTGPQMYFRNIESVGNGNISEYRMSNSNAATRIWNVTDPFNIREQIISLNGNLSTFRIPSDTLQQFIAFDGTLYQSPEFAGIVANQNLHGIGQADMIIVSHPDFITQANRLATIHSNNDGLNIVVVTPQQIYNEFSSGSQDVSAIRNFIRMLYSRATSTSTSPRYLLMFGDGSYDYKNRFTENTNYVPTYQSNISLIPTASYVTDDFFGLLDSTEGYYSNGALDIGIGRFPVKTIDEAKVLVDKVEIYLSKKSSYTEMNGCTPYTKHICGDWRNRVCFVADDEDNNLHIGQANELTNYIDTANFNINITKIFLDSYVQFTGSLGPSYPDANKALNKQVEDGALMINYTGHGGETGWTGEGVLKLTDINKWTNLYTLPVFVTATCEFSRFDDPERTSAGEQVLLNPKGGGIALFTTTRVAFSNTNFNLNKSFCKFAYKKYDGEYKRLGDLIRLAKIDNGSITNIRNFVLLGDPALRLSFPQNVVVTSEINGQDANISIDTLRALSEVTVSGFIQDTSGQKMTSFNGIIYPTVYDKKKVTVTLANDPSSSPYYFNEQKDILFKGKASVTNGDFTFSFVVPIDMDKNYGIGKISYYATDSLTDASGFYNGPSIVFGGVDSSVIDTTKPNINLYLDDESFIFGDSTNENPILLAYLKDSSGVNCNDLGFGHNIIAILDENTQQPIELNDYYTSDINSYNSGRVIYPFKSLELGRHKLKLKVWDLNNNSAESYTEFVVTKPGDVSLKNLYNFPNPFTDKTWFYFDHNQPCCDLEVEIRIYTITGVLVKTIIQTAESNGASINPIEWNGCNSNGVRLESGVYPYHVEVKAVNGSYLESSNKLIILR